jgi:hypothetical protein
MKQIVFLNSGLIGPNNILCGDTDHNGLNELILFSPIMTYPGRSVWEIWEHRPMNYYELVFADTGPAYYPPGIYTGNFRPEDIGDIDGDSLTDLLGPNEERANDSTYYIISTQESPNYTSYPELLSWWLRNSNIGSGSLYYFTPDLDRDGRKEMLTYEGFYGDTTRLMLIENIGNNQNIPVWRRFTYGGYFAFGDFDQDSLRDFVTANPGSSGYIYVFENTGNDQYERYCVDTVHIPNGTDVFSGNDVDSDGHPEFFIGFTRISGGTWIFYLYMWEATSNNTYQRTLVDHIAGGDWFAKNSKCGDIDGDSIDEIVWSIGTRVMVYKAIGNNQFLRVWEWYNNFGYDLPSSVVNVHDMNKNGYNEIVISGYAGNQTAKTAIFELEAVRLLSPNGGEVFQGDSNEVIHWQTFHPPRCDSLSLFYSIDNGRTYNLITSGLSGNDTSYLWTVPNVNSDSCRIKIIAYGPGWQYDESDGIFSITSTGIEERSPLSAIRFSLKTYPNPSKTLTAIRYSLPTESKVSLQLYNISGRLVKTLVNESKKSGIYNITLNTKTLSAGVYFLSLETEEKRIFERLVVVK